jgi:DNA-binding FadR family transcriptional regulator
VQSDSSAAQRIYAASISEGEAASRLAYGLAKRIEDEILSRNLPAGGLLGSLRELAERYAAGRSVTREAFGLLERRGLGRMRPGPCGGFILAKPRAEIIAEELAKYFRAIDVTWSQLLDAREAVDTMAARFAAMARPDDSELARLDASSAADGLSGHLAARREIARLAAQPVLLLFVECLNHLTADFGRAGEPPPPANPRCLVEMQCALRAGDVDAAAAAARRAHAGLAARVADRHPLRTVAVPPASPSRRDRCLAAVIASKLAAEIAPLSRAGARLGSESELCERFNVSRLTLRQAIRRLQDCGLVECRRGRGNGLLVRDRRAAGSIRLMLAYLIAEKMDPMAAGTILFQINCFVPVLAVSRANAEQRRSLEAALSRVESCDPFDRCDLLDLVHCVSHLAESPIIDLFSRCLAAYEARFRASLAESLPASAQASYFRLLRGLLERLPSADAVELERAKQDSATLMLEMSYRRPI